MMHSKADPNTDAGALGFETRELNRLYFHRAKYTRSIYSTLEK